MRIELGDVARDTITGFKGMVVAETQWLHGCRRLTLQPTTLKDGKPIDALTFDEPQCELVSTPARRELVNRLKGGPRPEPARARDPR